MKADSGKRQKNLSPGRRKGKQQAMSSFHLAGNFCRGGNWGGHVCLHWTESFKIRLNRPHLGGLFSRTFCHTVAISAVGLSPLLCWPAQPQSSTWLHPVLTTTRQCRTWTGHLYIQRCLCIPTKPITASSIVCSAEQKITVLQPGS